MRKKMTLRLSALVVLVAILAGCSNKTYTNALPADATAVVSVHLTSLADKSGLSDKDNEAIKQKLLDGLKSGMNADTYQQLEKVVNDPAASGIDVTAPVYLVKTAASAWLTVAKVLDEDNLRASIEAMIKEQIAQPLSETDGYAFTITDTGLLAFTPSTFLFVTAQGTSQIEKAKETASSLLKQTEDKSMVSHAIFKKMEGQEGDFRFFASLASLPPLYQQQAVAGLPSGVAATDVSMVGGLSFEKGKIALKAEYYTENDAIQAALKKQVGSYSKIRGTFSNYFPASTLVYVSTGIKGDKLCEMVEQNGNIGSMSPLVKSEEMKTLLQSLDGDISIGLINVTMSSAPTFVAYASVKNAQTLEAFYLNKKNLKLKKGEDILKLGKDEYVYKTRGMNIFFGCRDKQMYATNDELIYKNIGQSNSQSVKDAPYASEMKGKPTFMAIVNMEAILDLPIVKMFMGFGNEEIKTYSTLASKISYFFIGQEGEHIDIHLTLKDKDTNALKQFADFGKQFASGYTTLW